MSRSCCSALVLIVGLALAVPAGATEYYVSPSGNDTGGDGSQGRPWKTIQKAADTMSAGDTCHVLNGDYAEMVRPARSGNAGSFISFVAEGPSVSVVGTRPITAWTMHSGSIWQASAPWDFGELFVDRERMVIARWPNLTSGNIYRPNFNQATANGGKTSIIDAVNLTQPGGSWTGAKIFMVPGLGWTADQRDVTGYDVPSHRITFSPAISFSDYYDADEFSLYFMYDKLSLLDAASEWYLDRIAHTVYLWLPGGDSPEGHLVESAGGSGGFNLSDRSYIRVAGFSLMSGDIRMQNATHCRVEEVQHLYPAAELYVSGSDNVITRSEIAYASYTGVRLAGARNTLSKSHVHRCDYFGTYNSLVALGDSNTGSQNSIVDCLLHDTGRDGVVMLGALNASGSLIEHNEIYNTGLIAKDCGGFYAWGTNGGGTVIRYNVVHDIWPKDSPQYGPIGVGYGIYLDDASSDFSVHHNLVYRTAGFAIELHQPSRNVLVFNNTAIGSGGGWGDVISSNPGVLGSAVDGAVVANNLAVMLDDRKVWRWCIYFEVGVPAYHHNGYYNVYHGTSLNNQGVEASGVVGNPLFSSTAANDFTLLESSPMVDKGAVIPGITDGYLGVAPDIGAYERGGSEWPGPRLTFTDDPLVARTTPVRRVHLTELRAAIGALRVRRGLSAALWSDPTPGARATTVKTVHLTELRAALNEVYAALGRTPPTYNDAMITAGVTVITAVQLSELRAAVVAVW